MDKTFANHYSQMPDTHRAASLDEYKQQIKEALHANWKILYSSFDYYAVVTTTSGAEDRYDLFNINLNAYTRYARLTPWADPSAVPHRKRTFKLAAICVASLSTHAADANRVRTAVTSPSRCRHVAVTSPSRPPSRRRHTAVTPRSWKLSPGLHGDRNVPITPPLRVDRTGERQGLHAD